MGLKGREMTNYKYYPQTLVFLQFTIIGLMVLFSKGFFSSALSISIFTIGLLLGIWALRHNQLGNFNIQPKIKKDSNLITTGIYGYIRHPMYSSVIIMMFAFLVSSILPQKSRQFKKKSNSLQNSQPQALIFTDLS